MRFGVWSYDKLGKATGQTKMYRLTLTAVEKSIWSPLNYFRKNNKFSFLTRAHLAVSANIKSNEG